MTVDGPFTRISWQYCRCCLRDPAPVVYVKTKEYGFTKVCGECREKLIVGDALEPELRISAQEARYERRRPA
jgi:hypothetical protein